MKLLDFVMSHKAALWGGLMTVHGFLFHSFSTIRSQGGLRTIWREFMGPKPESGADLQPKKDQTQ